MLILWQDINEVRTSDTGKDPGDGNVRETCMKIKVLDLGMENVTWISNDKKKAIPVIVTVRRTGNINEGRAEISRWQNWYCSPENSGGWKRTPLFTLKIPVNVRMAEIFIILQLGLLTFLIIPCDYSNCLQATYKSHKSWNSSLNLEIFIVWQWDVCKCLHHELRFSSHRSDCYCRHQIKLEKMKIPS